jgi:hypothetical protein
VKTPISPLKLAKLEQAKRQRASEKKDDNQNKSDW